MATSLIPLREQKRLITYYVDTGTIYTAKVRKGEDCLSNLSFTPTLSGYTFLGWRQDTTASSSVLSSLTVASDAIVVYAVFTKTITLTYYNGSSTASKTTGTQYYNNGNITNPTFSLTAASVSGFTFSGWCTSSSATAEVTYSSVSNRSFSSDTTLYAKYYQTITITYYATSSTAATLTDTRYYNSGDYSNPTFTISSPSVSGWTFLGWISGSTSATGTVSYTSISNTAFTGSATLYAKFSQTITVSYNGNSSTGGSTDTQTSTRYWNAYGNYSNPSFTLASNGFTRTGYSFSKWALNSTSGTQYSAGDSVTLSADAVFYAIWTSNAYSVTFAKSQWSTSSYSTDGHSDSYYGWNVQTSNNTIVLTAYKASSQLAYVTVSITGTFDAKGCNRCDVVVYSNNEIATIIVDNVTKEFNNTTGTATFTISGSSSTKIELGAADTGNDGTEAYICISGIRFYNA